MFVRSALLLALALSGCATLPETVQFHFACSDGSLFLGAKFGEEMYVADVGRCLGNLKIIGHDKGTGL